MQNITAATKMNGTAANTQPYYASVCSDAGYKIKPQTLARVDFGLFQSLCSLGTSAERICSALNINQRDFDYLLELSDSKA